MERTSEYDEVVRTWSGFDKDTWNLLEREIKDKFCDSYDEAESLEEFQDD